MDVERPARHGRRRAYYGRFNRRDVFGNVQPIFYCATIAKQLSELARADGDIMGAIAFCHVELRAAMVEEGLQLEEVDVTDEMLTTRKLQVSAMERKQWLLSAMHLDALLEMVLIAIEGRTTSDGGQTPAKRG